MTAVIQSLKDLQYQLINRAVTNYADTQSYTLSSITAFLFDKFGINVDINNDAVQTTISVSSQQIDLLSGRIVSDAYGNLFLRAQGDNSVFQTWNELAQSCGETLSLALNYTSYSVADYFHDVADRETAAAAQLADTGEGVAQYAIVIAVLVLLIVILK